MKLSIRLALGLLAVAFAAPDVRATNTVLRCTGGQFAAYYVLVNEQVAAYNVLASEQTYREDPNSLQFHRFTEFGITPNEPPVFYALCSNDIPVFESEKGIHTGDPVRRSHGHPSELFEILDANDVWVGTVWRDTEAPFDQGGSIGKQSYWICLDEDNYPPPGVDVPMIDNFAGFSSGLDAAGINGVKDDEKEQFYFSYIRARFTSLDSAKMESSICTHLADKEAFLALPSNALARTQTWFRNYDPSGGGGDTPP